MKMKKEHVSLLFIAGGFAFYALGYGTSAIIGHFTEGTLTENTVREHGIYTYVAPLLICGATERKDYGPFKDLSAKVQTLIDAKIKSGLATNVSMFFRDTKGHWVGVNDSDLYPPASLLKVPLMIAYYKEAENNPTLLDERYTYPAPDTSNLNTLETFQPKNKLQPGVSYSVEELIEAMVSESDNNATELLREHIDPKIVDEVYTDVGIPVANQEDPNIADMSPKMYASFLRVLYNATYLTPEYSEKALSLLAKSSFDEGLAAGVPTDIKVADKYGERTEVRQDGLIVSRNLNDCGAIYATDNTYFLCIMAKGQDFKGLTSTIKDISKAVYEEVDSRY